MSLAAVGASIGLGRLAARRVATDRAFLLALWIVVTAATTLVAAAFQYSDAVAIGGLQRAVLNAAPADRGISVQTDATADQVAGFNGTVTGILTSALGPIAPVALAARSSSLAPAGMPSEQAALHLTVLGSYDRLDQHAQLTAGSWAVAGRDPIEATLSETAARALGLKIGDRLALADASVPAAGSTALLTVVVTGTWTTDPDDPYWLGDPLDLDGRLDQGSLASEGPFMVAPADLLSRGLIHRLSLTWRAGLVTSQLVPADVPALQQAIPGLAPALTAAMPARQSIRITTGLSAVLAGVHQSLAVAQGGVTLLTLQFIVLAAFAVVLVAALLGERRRRENRILESRGATRFQIVTVTTGEAILVTLPAVIVAPPLAALAIHLLGSGGPLAGAGVDLPLSVSSLAIAGADPGRHDRGSHPDRADDLDRRPARVAPAGARAGEQPRVGPTLRDRPRAAVRRRPRPVAAPTLRLAGHDQHERQPGGRSVARRRPGHRPRGLLPAGHPGLAPVGQGR